MLKMRPEGQFLIKILFPFYTVRMSTFYLTTSIAYTNSKPHVGFAMELVQGDTIARYHRLIGDDVRFLTGTDEHGLKMVQTARDRGILVEQLADENSAEFRRLTSFLQISNDHFIRTTDGYHVYGCQRLWERLKMANALYKKTYEGLYCVGCEAYITEKDLVDGMCPNHRKEPIKFKEENYFFRYSAYLPKIKELIKNDVLKIIPASRKNEMLGLIEVGIEEKKDISFSRPTEALAWGIPVPDDPTQAMYVWCDALSNYITGCGFEAQEENISHETKGTHDPAPSLETFKKFWPADVHLIGKDIVRFHAGFWIAMLMAADLPLPKAIYVHGYITSEGQKMSKSLGNVVDPFEIGGTFGVDALRYYLLREIPTTDDGDFNKDRFNALYNGELANNLGNLVSRVLTMAEKYCGGKIPACVKEEPIMNKVLETWKKYQGSINDFNLKEALESVFGLMTFANQYIDEQKPWILAKTEPIAVHTTLYNLLEIIRHASLMLMPFLPSTSEKIQTALNYHCEKLYPNAIDWGVLKEGTSISKPEILFPKIEN